MKPLVPIAFGIPILFVLVMPACRDTNFVNSNGRVDGYRIEGTVLDGLEQPISNIPVSLHYSPDFISNTPEPVREYTLESPGELVNFDVYDNENALVRNLYSGTPGGPTISVSWDHRRNDGAIVGSGIYTVRVTVGGNLRHSYVEFVNGSVTARTDADGIFTISDLHLPIGYSPVPIYSTQNTFTGNYRVSNLVHLEFNVGGIIHSYSLLLTAGRVFRLPVRID